MLSSSPITKTASFLHDLDGLTVIQDVQDVEGIIDLNKAQYNSVDERARWNQSGENHIARIPNVVYWDLVRRQIIEPGGDGKRFLRWLDEPENRAFRVRPGRLSR